MTNHAAEEVLKDAAPEVVFVRCGYFMENWAAALETIPEAGFFFTTLTPVDYKLPHVSPTSFVSPSPNQLTRGTVGRIAGHRRDMREGAARCRWRRQGSPVCV